MPHTRTARLCTAALVLGLALTGAGTTAAANADDTPAPTPAAPSSSATPTPTSTPTDGSGTGSSTGSTTTSPSPTAGATTTVTPSTAPRAAAQAATAYVPQCAAMPAGATTPYDASYFNYPFSGVNARNHIRYMVLHAINSTPGCDVAATAPGYRWNIIRIAAYSLNDNTTVDALIRAVRRGVQVQVISDSHNMGRGPTSSPSFQRLVRTLNYNRSDGSYAKVCSRSCRGSAGNHHYKMYLFSHTGAKHDVAMAGSANLTMKAAGGQWNHLDVYTSQATYDTYTRIFGELALDRPQAHPWRDYLTGAVRTWFFPRPGTRASNDPLMVGTNSLSGISCRGSAFGDGRTVIRIGMYAWYESRGLWLAQKVRYLWNAGCNVAVEYAVMGNTVKRVLYSPSGRGRIPMRQVATYYHDGTVADYDHQKYVTIAGRYNGVSNATVTWAGTTNWSNLGIYSDDLTQVWHDGTRAAAYRKAFYNVWRGPHVRVPSPTSALPGKVGTGNITFGKGKYRNLEAN